MTQQKIVVFVLAILVVSSIAEEAQPITLPKLPLFIGKGYDILVGNPLSSEGVDPGFQH